MDTLAPTTIEPIDLSAEETVGHSRAGRFLAVSIALILVTLPVVLAFVPWQQNVPGSGYVSAVDPLDRIRTIPAPVGGRLVKLHVQEGARVREGDLLAEMADLDQDRVMRLEQQFEFAGRRLQAAHETLERLDDQIIELLKERDSAIEVAEAQLESARQRVRKASEYLRGEEARLVQLELDFERKKFLYEKETISELAYQRAEADFKAAQADVNAAGAAVEEASREEDAWFSRIGQIRAEKEASIRKAEAEREDARQKLNQVETERTEAQTALARQKTQTVAAPRDGTILRIHGATTSDLISRGDPLIELVPDTEGLAVEFWVRGIDAPLVTPGRRARLQFEGWPAVQFAGWPSVAVGTFGGIVRLSDAQARADGKVRVLVVPDPDDEPWPDPPFLRQGVRTNGWVQLDTVSVGYEIWRQLNQFPPTVDQAPITTDGKVGETKGGGDGKGETP